MGTCYSIHLTLNTLIDLLNIFVTPLDLPSPPHLYVLCALWIDGTSLFPGPGQLWLSLGLSLLSVPPCGIVFHRPLAIPFSLLICISVDLGGQPGHVPSVIEKRPCIYHFLPPFAPQYFGLPQYFDKSTPVLI